jgi:predicted nucleotidyltransferase
MGKTATIREQIDEMVERIVERFDPDRIILFGSHACGTGGPDSDVDLLIVMPVEGSKRQKQLEVRMALHDFRLPKDVIVSRSEEFPRRKDITGTIEYPASREGEVLYVRPGE